MSLLPATLCSLRSSPPRQQREFSRQLWPFSCLSLPLSFFFLQADWNQRSRPTSNRKLEPLQANRRNRQDSSSPTVRLNERGLFWRIRPQTRMMNHNPFPHMIMIFSATKLLLVRTVKEVTEFRFIFYFFGSKLPSLKVTPLNGRAFMIGRKKFIHGCVIAPLKWTICSIITL